MSTPRRGKTFGWLRFLQVIISLYALWRRCEHARWPNSRVKCYLSRTARGSCRIVRDRPHGHNNPIQSSTPYLRSPNANAGLVFDDEVTSVGASGGQDSIGSTNGRKGDQTVPPQCGGTEGGSQYLSCFSILDEAGGISRTPSNASTT